MRSRHFSGLHRLERGGVTRVAGLQHARVDAPEQLPCCSQNGGRLARARGAIEEQVRELCGGRSEGEPGPGSNPKRGTGSGAELTFPVSMEFFSVLMTSSWYETSSTVFGRLAGAGAVRGGKVCANAFETRGPHYFSTQGRKAEPDAAAATGAALPSPVVASAMFLTRGA